MAFECDSISVTTHAASRMYRRQIGFSQLREMLAHAVVIEVDDHPTDPKYLLSGSIQGRPLHMVLTRNVERRTCQLVTIYDPDPALWDSSFRRRRSQ